MAILEYLYSTTVQLPAGLLRNFLPLPLPARATRAPPAPAGLPSRSRCVWSPQPAIFLALVELRTGCTGHEQNEHNPHHHAVVRGHVPRLVEGLGARVRPLGHVAEELVEEEAVELENQPDLVRRVGRARWHRGWHLRARSDGWASMSARSRVGRRCSSGWARRGRLGSDLPG